ncbi:MAG TPA: OB-fold nucleic acid binding domain-containing protein, partial [Vicinamibacterales bacterium]|nr:OB-fold nucleic acid binding domain-containing protein [Vicinamibacterales bacterium]
MKDDVLQTPLQFLKGVGPRKAADLKKAGLNTVEDLLFRFPRRYEDRSKLQKIISLRPGMTAAVSGVVLNAGLAQTRRPGFKLFSALIQDGSGSVQAVWPNQAFLKDVIKSKQRIVLFGKVEIWGSRGLQITDPEFEIVNEGGSAVEGREPAAGNRDDTEVQLHTGRIVPVYERTGMVTTNMQRRYVWQALEQVPADAFDPVPADILQRERWPARREALWQTHFPAAETSVDQLNAFTTPAQRRLVFEDFFVFQTGLALRRHENAQVKKRLICTVDDRIRQRARDVLPFKLTAGQREAL